MNATVTTSHKSADEKLLERIANSDERAFEILIDRHAPLVERAAMASQLDPSEVPDLVQATFIVLWDRRKALPPTPKLGGWLYGVTTNLARHHIRSRSRARQREQNWYQHRNETMTHHTEISQESQIPTEHRLALHRSLEKLGTAPRQIIISRFWQKKPFAVIGQELGCSEDAAKKRFAAALKKLAGLLAVAGLSSTASAAVENLLESEAALPSAHAAAAKAALHAPTAAARQMATLLKPLSIFLPYIIGGAAALIAALIAVNFFITPSTGKTAHGTTHSPSLGQEGPARARGVDSRPKKAALIPISEWKSSDPTVLLKSPGNRSRGGIWHLPLPIQWLNGTPFVPVVSGLKTDHSTFHLFKNSGGTWEEAVTIKGLHIPTLVAVSDGSMGIVGYTGESPDGGYGASLFYYRYDPQSGVSEPWTMATSPTPSDRIVLVGLDELPGMQLSAVMLLESRGSSDKQLLESVSSDGGKTWSEPVARRKTGMSEDDTRSKTVNLGQEGLGVFVRENGKPLELLVAPPGGGDWESRPVQLTDGLPVDHQRMPLKALSTPSAITLAYLATESEGKEGTYYTTTSRDSGRTWSDGLPVAKIGKVDDASMMFNLTTNGNQFIANYLEVTKGKKLATKSLASDDGGRTWTDVPGTNADAFLGLVSFSPSGGRAYAAELVPGPEKGSECFQVRELAPPAR